MLFLLLLCVFFDVNCTPFGHMFRHMEFMMCVRHSQSVHRDLFVMHTNDKYVHNMDIGPWKDVCFEAIGLILKCSFGHHVINGERTQNQMKTLDSIHWISINQSIRMLVSWQMPKLLLTNPYFVKPLKSYVQHIFNPLQITIFFSICSVHTHLSF